MLSHFSDSKGRYWTRNSIFFFVRYPLSEKTTTCSTIYVIHYRLLSELTPAALVIACLIFPTCYRVPLEF